MCEQYIKTLEQILNLSALITRVVIILVILVSVLFLLYKVIKNIITKHSLCGDYFDDDDDDDEY